MQRKLNEIKSRYGDVICSVDERQMLDDIQALLAYVENMKTVLARQAQVRQAELVLREFEKGGAYGMRFPC